MAGRYSTDYGARNGKACMAFQGCLFPITPKVIYQFLLPIKRCDVYQDDQLSMSSGHTQQVPLSSTSEPAFPAEQPAQQRPNRR
ncbi:hypothetical protein COO20_25075 [Thalassospira marina]|uniref:Uncharacterized protein n=1 Tax=Thalassospira marina TaxID=2048283 RepID=A0A2N3KBU5_9PROT|nr:hypothetical protein COO20_25075 [Thalassospira marina]